jgi:hypothetical protein
MQWEYYIIFYEELLLTTPHFILPTFIFHTVQILNVIVRELPSI